MVNQRELGNTRRVSPPATPHSFCQTAHEGNRAGDIEEKKDQASDFSPKTCNLFNSNPLDTQNGFSFQWNRLVDEDEDEGEDEEDEDEEEDDGDDDFDDDDEDEDDEDEDDEDYDDDNYDDDEDEDEDEDEDDDDEEDDEEEKEDEDAER